ncbi:MAG: multicomponent Na+:H+ antiporter subunit [Actinomycetota bacterium]|jgi:multicomponent Na+:H+ antiporter subunit G|nr:multicomponent Na+:H+ antiporter subunit [Actinomycetota bacterium]
MQHAVATVLLFVGVLVELMSCLGILAMRHFYDRLHYVGPASTLGAFLIGAALVVEDALKQQGVKSILVVMLLVLISPVLTHATARAARIREFGRWVILEEEQTR